MIYWTNYIYHNMDIQGKRKLVDNTIYTFDIESTSYFTLNGKIYPGIEYQNLSEDEKEICECFSCMYVWMFSINDVVYFGRTWEEFQIFIDRLFINSPDIVKIIYIHNLAFEFQYLKSVLHFDSVMARKSHKVMKAINNQYNLEFRCSLFLSNCKLALLPQVYQLPVEKMVGDLDYNLVRTPITPLTKEEMGYCENDCLVLYYYIKKELETYERIDKIPLTSTGHVRRELKELVLKDYEYKRKVRTAINTDPHIYNLLTQAFMGGYTHANWVYADKIIENVDSWDFTSSYPYVLTTHKYPSTEFKKGYVKSYEQLSERFAYLLVVKFYNIKSKYYNNFISGSKCRDVKGIKYDNGRVISAEEITLTLTDIDFRFIMDSHKIEKYEIIESYYSSYNYLPKQFINFVLDKYVEKTEYKNVEGKEVEYNIAKQRFNSLYGMSVTNNIRDEVVFNSESLEWAEIPLSNDEILKKLDEEKKASFLSFAYGVWVTAYARNNLLRNVVKLDDYVVYCDTDSAKLADGYDKSVIDEYNQFVEGKIKYVSEKLDIPIEKYSPCDCFGEPHTLGLFDKDAHYEKFITQGAKKYAYYKYIKKSKIKNDTNVIKIEDEKALVLEITVSGVPKCGAKALTKIEDFKDDLIFPHDITNKNLLIYCENQEPHNLVDYLGNEYIVNDKSGCCILPTTYILGKSDDYAELLSDDSSTRAIYKE